MNQPQEIPDPFASSAKAPALSFKDAPVGTEFTGTIDELPVEQRARDYETGDPASWPDGRDKMVAIVGLTVNGEARTIWAVRGTSMHAAISDASKTAGERIAIGGELTVSYTGDKPNKSNPRLKPAKQYKATYRPPTGRPAVATAPPAAATVAPKFEEQGPDAPPW